ncbi:hypothetical protein AB6A40_011000 [Gnathostoma spinigerum]|uniref:Uncharacterized protein n=1 Tax=Gnathostoma spinigerum TaxID=75299 RepID=A0ABD6EWL7_9BILA
MCSDSNIEIHYGAFFGWPRDVHDSNNENPPKCTMNDAVFRLCHDPCFTLNVTSSQTRNGRLVPFGTF